jgi:hypothetical protein
LERAFLADRLEEAVPREGQGTFRLLGMDRPYRYRRGQLGLKTAEGHLSLDVPVSIHVDLPIKAFDTSVMLHVTGEPVLTSSYEFRMQSPAVRVDADQPMVALVASAASVPEALGQRLARELADAHVDVRPLFQSTVERLTKPVAFDVGETQGCARFKLMAVEAGPTVFADGIEKDLALDVLPRVTIPCEEASAMDGLPPLTQVPMVPSGPFSVTVPILARLDELTRALGSLFTDGRFYFSKEHPELYLEKPEVYASQDRLVLKLHLKGPVKALGFDADLDGDIFFHGEPRVSDNEVRLDNLEPTVETKDLLLSLKALADGDRLRMQAREALRLDLSPKFADAQRRWSEALQGESNGICWRGAVDHMELKGIYAHKGYLRSVVEVVGRAQVEGPCRSTP